MRKSKNNNNFSILSFVKKILLFLFKSIIKIVQLTLNEIYKTLKLAGYGLFKIFDVIITNLISVITYVIYGFIYMFEYIGKFTYKVGNFTYKYILYPVINELYCLFKAIFIGFYKVIKVSFYEFPLFVFNSFSDFFDLLAKKLKQSKKSTRDFLKNAPNIIKNYFVNKFNNLSVVKHYRNKKERELEILLIDKNGKDAERSAKKQTYQYLARDENNKLVKGYFASLSKLDVHSYLIDAGFEVYEIKTNWWINFAHNKSKYLENPMKTKDLIFWLTQLSTYIKSGIPLTDAVKILSEQDKRKKYKKVYSSVIYELTIGETFSEALKKQGNVFPALLINMIKASELIGDLENTLDDMGRYYEEKEITRKQMVGAMIYPSIILVFAVIVIAFMLLYIVPEFEKVYLQLGGEMNAITKLLLSISAFLKSKIFIIISIIVTVIVVFVILYKKVKAFKTLVQYIYMHIPVIGKLVIYNEINLFAKTFAVLNKNNVLLTDSIDILSKITTNEFYKMLMYDTISNLLRGDKISLSFKDNWAVPQLAYYMITTGESTGELSSMLEKVSQYYSREQRNLSTTLKTLVEPILMVFLAVVVGGIMVGVLLPMYDIGSGLL